MMRGVTFSTRGGREYISEPLDPDAIIAALAARQHGVVTIAQLLEAGLDHDAVRRRMRAQRLHRIHRGVYAVGHPGLSFEGRSLAAVLACGAGSGVGHLTAAEVYRTSRWPRRAISVVTRTQRRPEGVEVHHCRGLDPRDLTTFKGIPITTVPRMLIDLADTMTAHQLAWVIHEAAFRHLFDLEATRAAVERANGRRGVAALNRAIELHLSGSAGTRSAAEDVYLASLPDADSVFVNTKLEVDLRWPDGRIVEIDGLGHDRPPARREDAERDARLTRAGYRVSRRRPPRDG
jgi:hypothetical protein